MSAVRLSGALLVGALLFRITLFVASDSRLADLKALAIMERRLARLIDEAVRHCGEERDRHESAEFIGVSVRHVTRRAAIRVMAKVAAGLAIAWNRMALLFTATGSVASSAAACGFGSIMPAPQERGRVKFLGLVDPIAVVPTASLFCTKDVHPGKLPERPKGLAC